MSSEVGAHELCTRKDAVTAAILHKTHTHQARAVVDNGRRCDGQCHSCKLLKDKMGLSAAGKTEQCSACPNCKVEIIGASCTAST
jgi:hypothetical protein